VSGYGGVRGIHGQPSVLSDGVMMVGVRSLIVLRPSKGNTLISIREFLREGCDGGSGHNGGNTIGKCG